MPLFPRALPPPGRHQALLDVGGGGAGFCSPLTPAGPCDIEAAYAQALRTPSDMHLMRLIMKTGPCWSALSEQTAAGLLAAFTRCLQSGVMLHRVLPWLWRLADEGRGPCEVAPRARRQLLDALMSCPAAEDLQVWWLGPRGWGSWGGGLWMGLRPVAWAGLAGVARGWGGRKRHALSGGRPGFSRAQAGPRMHRGGARGQVW
jgi:hypothetical protein